ncbi:MAG TPA: HEAT repeat domain-containing protein [Blastocatellia bacterium]|nr:HEAT repeat domain-containing protein [Blastocatellia bacterium]
MNSNADLIDQLATGRDPRAAARLVPFLNDELLRARVAEILGRIGDEETAGALAAFLNDPTAPAEVFANSLAAIHDRYQKRYGGGAEIADLTRGLITATGTQNLLDAIDRANADEVRGLALVLGWLKGAAVERALTRLLGRPTAREEVVAALVRSGDHMTEILIEQLEADDLDTRQTALIALGRLGDPSAIDAIVRLIREDEELIVIAVGALAKIGDRQAFEPLLNLLGHRLAVVRLATVSALNSLSHPELPARIRLLLSDPNPLVRESAVRIGGYFGYADCVDLILERCHDPVENVRCTALEQLPYLDESAIIIETLVRALHAELPRVRAAAVRAFGNIEIESSWGHLQPVLSDPDDWVRYFAVRSIGRRDLKAAADYLAEMARTDAAPQVRIAAIEAIGSLSAPESTAILAPLAEAEDLDLARAAISALGEIEHPQALGALLIARESSDAPRRLAAVEALAGQSGAEAVEALRRSAADADELVAQAAIEGLAQSVAAGAVEALISVASATPRREDCIDALAQAGQERIDELARGLNRPQFEARCVVVEALGRTDHRQAAEYLQLALNDSNAAVRQAAIAALGHSRGRNRR